MCSLLIFFASLYFQHIFIHYACDVWRIWYDGLLGRGFVCFFAVFVAFHVKIGPWEKESEALQLLRIIWEKVAKMPKDDIADILRGPRVRVQNKKKDKESEVMPLIRTILEKIDKGEAIPKSEIAEEYTT
ncbi:hypothetical protein Hanom_Chr05g00434001 [Helianthus anomalus]